MSEPLLYDSHTHTPLCGHAVGSPEEYAAVAWERHLKGIIFTCHNPMPADYGHTGRMTAAEVGRYREIVGAARAAFEGRLEVHLGIECDYFPGYESHLERQLAGQDFQFVLGSLHPFLPIWLARWGDRDPLEQQRLYFTQLADAAETGLFDSLSHPDLIKNQTAEDWRLERVLDHVRVCLDRIAVAGTAMELNTSGPLKRLPEMNPAPEILAEMRQRGIPVTLGSDAHVPERVGDRFGEALDLLESAGYEEVSYFLGRSRHNLPLAAARDSLVALT